MEEKVGFFKRLKNGLSKTRDSFVSGIDSLFTGFSEIDDDFYEELEELLVMGDIGINTTMSIIDGLKERVKEEKIKEASACKQLLIDTIKEQMQIHEDAYEFEHKKSVLLLIGNFIHNIHHKFLDNGTECSSTGLLCRCFFRYRHHGIILKFQIHFIHLQKFAILFQNSIFRFLQHLN